MHSFACRWISSLAASTCLFLVLLGHAERARSAEIPQVSPAEAGLDESKLAEVHRFVSRQIENQQIAGGIVVIWHQGKIGYINAMGLRDIEAHKPMQTDTIVRLYSMSKAITTAAALRLCDEGKLDLDDPVSKYIPGFANLQVATAEGELRAPARPMVVRDLMLHTSGLTYGGVGPEALREGFARLRPMQSANLAEMADKLSQIPLAFDPGTDWTYGVGIDVLGRVIEVASSLSLDDYLRQAIFEPLAMPDTAFRVPPEKLERFAANYGRSAEGLKLIDAPGESHYGQEVTFFSGGGGLVGTVGDYLRFLAMVMNGGELDGQRILRPESVALMTSNQLPEQAFPIRFGTELRHGTGFGLGFSVRTEITTWDPAGHVGECGWGGAASTHYWLSPADDLIVVTIEQIMPYQWDTEFGVKKFIYDALLPEGEAAAGE